MGVGYGVGYGVGCAAGSPPGGQANDDATLPGLRWPVWKPRSSTSRRHSRPRYRCYVGMVTAERLALGVWALGMALGSRQGRPRVRRSKGRWVALPPPVSRRPGSYPSPLPRRRRPQRAGEKSPEQPPTPPTPREAPTESQHPLYKKTPRSGRKFFGRWVFNFGRWVLTALGVGRWMPLAKALGGVRARREATARSALMRAPAGSSRPRKVDGGVIGHPGSGGV